MTLPGVEDIVERGPPAGDGAYDDCTLPLGPPGDGRGTEPTATAGVNGLAADISPYGVIGADGVNGAGVPGS